MSGAWLPGDPLGGRRLLDIGPVPMETADPLPDVTIAYESWGTLSPSRDNAVLVLHALTGDTHVVGERGTGHPTPGWWNGLIGPGRAIDTDRWFVVAPNILGGCQGSTGPSSLAADGRPWGSRFPFLTTRDQVTAEVTWADQLGLDRWALVLGGSAGGMRALEWAVQHPGRVERLLLLATTPEATADQIGWCHVQIEAIRADPRFCGGDYYDAAPGDGPDHGLAVARRIAHLTYRSAYELGERFGRQAQDGEDPFAGGRYAVESYLDHHGTKLVGRFDANSYVVLSNAMNSHDIGRGRGGIPAALAMITARTVVAAIDSDRLYPPAQSERLAAGIAGVTEMTMISSSYGHDGFLIEVDAVAGLIGQLLS